MDDKTKALYFTLLYPMKSNNTFSVSLMLSSTSLKLGFINIGRHIYLYICILHSSFSLCWRSPESLECQWSVKLSMTLILSQQRVLLTDLSDKEYFPKKVWIILTYPIFTKCTITLTWIGDVFFLDWLVGAGGDDNLIRGGPQE